jgi:hypothetical protein
VSAKTNGLLSSLPSKGNVVSVVTVRSPKMARAWRFNNSVICWESREASCSGVKTFIVSAFASTAGGNGNAFGLPGATLSMSFNE